eukprot:1293799-Rhodomonas_salina.1
MDVSGNEIGSEGAMALARASGHRFQTPDTSRASAENTRVRFTRDCPTRGLRSVRECWCSGTDARCAGTDVRCAGTDMRRVGTDVRCAGTRSHRTIRADPK